MKQLKDYNFFDPEVIECPYEFYKLVREQAPVMELPQAIPGSKLFLVTRYDLVMEILKEVEVFSSNFSTLLAGREEQDEELQKIYAQGWPEVNTLLTADPPEHERFRVLVNKAFTASRVKNMQNYGFSTKNQSFQVTTIARTPVFGAGARSDTKLHSNVSFENLSPSTE